MNYVRTFLLAVFILSCTSFVFAETITMTTYYPSPAGNYTNMTNQILTITGNILFSTSGQTYFAGINGGTLYINPGGAFATTGMTVRSTGEIGIKRVATAGVELDVAGDLAASTLASSGTLAVSGASSLQAVTATTISGTVITATTRLETSIIDSNGAATLSINNNTQVNGNLTTTGVGSVGGNLNVAGNVTAAAYFHSSDERLKEEIVPVTDAINKVKAINGVYFKFKDKEEKKMGLIAQNVEMVVPEVVVTDSEGMKSVDYSSLVALLIEAVKEQQVMIDELKEKVGKGK